MKALYLTVLISVFSLSNFAYSAEEKLAQCKTTIAKAIYKKYPSIKKSGGFIDLAEINIIKESQSAEVGFASQSECSAGVTVTIEFLNNEKCLVKDISEMDEQC